jgi:carboxyl-terminal processing protease
MNMGFPDVCLTPSFPSPIPIPYPNMGMHAMAAPFCATILLGMMPALNMGSVIPMTTGDELGVANPFFMQMGMFTMGSPKVILQGMPAITLTSSTAGNNMNNPVGAVLVPGSPNILFTDAGGGDRSGHAVDVEPLPGGVLRISIRFFTAAVPAAVHAAIDRHTPGALIFDLRDNPGGELSAAVELARDLLPEGAVIAAIVDRDGDETVHRARGDAHGLPIVVRVNRWTASAAEVFAGCLKAHGRALVVGERTYGKGTVSAHLGAASVEVARVVLPNGDAIDGAGIAPDVEEA